MVKLDKSSRRMNTKRMSKPRILKSIPAIIRAFGEIHGPVKCSRVQAKRRLAEWADVGLTAVCNWESDNYIPEGWHYRMHLHLESYGYVVDPAALGVKAFGVAERLRRVA